MRSKILVLIIAFFSIFLLTPVQAADYGLGATVKATGGSLPTSIKGAKSLPQLAGLIVNVALSLIGIVFFILMLYAGIRWMTAMGNSEDVTKSKDMIVQAIIGLIIVMMSYAISSFVFSSLGAGGTGSSTGAATTPTGGSGGAFTHKDGEKCSAGAIKTGKWNCGAGTAAGAGCDTGECQTLCRYNHKDGECVAATSCSSPKVHNVSGLCPDDANDISCCFTP